jgi:hypothetical protein
MSENVLSSELESAKWSTPLPVDPNVSSNWEKSSEPASSSSAEAVPAPRTARPAAPASTAPAAAVALRKLFDSSSTA